MERMHNWGDLVGIYVEILAFAQKGPSANSKGSLMPRDKKYLAVILSHIDVGSAGIAGSHGGEINIHCTSV